MDAIICHKCKQAKPTSEFYYRNSGYQDWCKDCKREYKREYYKRPEAKNAQRKLYERLRDEGYFRQYARRQRQDPRLRIRLLARKYTNKMIKSGIVIKEPCAFCGQEQTNAHHPDYNEPLLIVWLCKDCHYNLHLKG